MVKKEGVYKQVLLYCSDREEQFARGKGLTLDEFLDRIKQFAIDRAIRNLSRLNTPEARKAISHYYEEEKRLSEGEE